MLELQRKQGSAFFGLLSLPATAMGFALSVQISALSWLLRTKFHLDLHEIGLVWAAGPLAGIVGQVLVGIISDRVWFLGGRRKPFIAIGGTLAALMLFLLPRIGAVDNLVRNAFGVSSLIVVATAVALTLDLAINVSFNPARAIIADVTPEGQPRTSGYTWMQTVSGFWGVLAYVVGASFGNETLIHAGVWIVLLFSLVPALLIEEPRLLAPEVSAGAVEQEARTDWPQLWKIWVAHGFSWLGVQTMFVFIIAFIEQRLVPGRMGAEEAATRSGAVISTAFAVLNTVGFLVPALVLNPLIRRWGRVRTHSLALGLMAVGYFAIARVATTSFALYALMALVGIGWGAIVSVPFAIMSEEVNKRKMGLFMGVFNLSIVIPQLVVSLFVGRFIQAAPDKGVVFLFCAVTLAVSATLWRWVRENAPEATVAARAPVGAH